MMSGHLKNRTPQDVFSVHFQRSFKEKLLTNGVKQFAQQTCYKKFHTATKSCE